MTLLLVSLTLLLTYVVAADIVFLVLSRLLESSRPGEDLRLFVLSRGAGPALLSVVTYMLLLLLPGRTRTFYLVSMLVVLTVGAVWSWHELGRLVGAYRRVGRQLAGLLRRAPASPPLLATVVVVLAATVFAIAFPIVEHDALGAAIEARIMARDASMANYLQVFEPDPQTGYFMPNFRTPFLQTLYVWFAWVGSPDHMDLLARSVSPFYALWCLALLAMTLAEQGGFRDAVWGMALLGTTPLFFYTFYNNGTDTAALGLAFAALVLVAKLTETGGLRLALATGFFAGLALYGHMLNTLTLGGGGLTFLVLRPWQVRRRLTAGLVVVIVAFFLGAQFHYVIYPPLLESISRSVNRDFVKETAAIFLETETPSSEDPSADPAASPVTPVPSGDFSAAPAVFPAPSAASPATPVAPVAFPEVTGPPVNPEVTGPPPVKKPTGELTAVEVHKAVLQVRGQGVTPWSHLVFGRLQMLTGFEHFGTTFYFFFAAVLLGLRRRKDVREKVFLAATFLAMVVVISGLRKLSWSNPRYIGSLLVLVAFFGSPILSRLEDLFRSRLRFRFRPLASWALVLFLAFPAILATSIRGAKISITNSGSFYKDFRSLRWIDLTLETPGVALRKFWDEYFGIRKTFLYLFSDDQTKLRHSHDYFAAVLYVNEATEPDAKILVFRDARFFYYGKRYGVVYFRPDVEKLFFHSKNPEELHSNLCGMSFTHVVSDAYSELYRGYVNSFIGNVLAAPRLATEVFEYGTARVFRLSCPADSQPPERAASPLAAQRPL